MADFRLQLTGFAAANRDAQVTMVEETTGKEINRKPFLDGSLMVRSLDPGFYQVKLTHPNLINPIFAQRIRLFPSPKPTLVTIPVPADLFTDAPIRDIPDADLGPVQQTLSTTRSQIAPIGNKVAGEVIRSSDWNTLVGAVSDLTGAVLDLTKLVAPRGHDHPEIAEKIAEVQKNILTFAEAYGNSLLQLQREIESNNMRRKLNDMFDLGQVPDAQRKPVLDKVDELSGNLQLATPVWTSKLSSMAGLALTKVNDVATSQPDPDTFFNDKRVQEVVNLATQYHQAGVQSTSEGEINIYRRTTGVAKTSKLGV